MVLRTKVLLGIALFLVAACIALVFSQRLLAAGPSYSLTTSPVSLDLHIKPGSTTTQTLQLDNNSSTPLPITMQVEVFGAYGTTGQAAITKPQAGDNYTNWVSFSPSSFIAQPSVWSSVKMTIKLPPSANLGYYYAIIFKPTLPPQSQLAHSTIFKGSNAILVLVDTGSANESRQVEITNFSVSKSVYEFLPINFNITLHNNGNIFLAPSGDIFISRKSNITDTIASIPINHSGANVLPNSSRVFTSSWSDGFPVFQTKTLDGQPVVNNKGQPVEQLQWNFSSPLSKFRFGKYYAQLALTYNNGTNNRLLISEVSFWVIPWKLIIIILLAVAALIAVWTFFKKGIKKAWRKVRKK